MIVCTSDHTYVDDATGRTYPGVTQIIYEAGLMGYMPGDDWYMTRGTLVHECTAMWDCGILWEEALDPALTGFLAAWKRYRADTGFTPAPDFIERICFDPVLGYAGTIDRDGLDIKAGVPTKWFLIQAAAYWHSPEVNKGPWRTVFLREEGTYKVIVYNPQDLYRAFQVFTAALTLYAWKAQNGLLTSNQGVIL